MSEGRRRSEITTSKGKFRTKQNCCNDEETEMPIVVVRNYETTRTSEEASIRCIETAVDLGEVKPRQTKTVSLHFIALKQGLLPLDCICLYDRGKDKYFQLADVPMIYAADA